MCSLPAAVTVYGASRSEVDPRYLDAAREVGRLVAEAGMALVSGGGARGLMAAAIEGALDAGGTAIGVLPQFMIDRQWQHPRLSQMIATPDMHGRKATMAASCRAVIAMPGGIGTFEELLEIITWRQLGLFKGRVVILNTLGYYRPLLDMLASAAKSGFMRHGTDTRLWAVADTPAEAVALALG